MRDPNLLLFATVGFPLVLIGFMVHTLRVQREAVQRSVIALERQQESMQVQRHILEILEENLSLQHEIRSLLERVALASERRV